MIPKGYKAIAVRLAAFTRVEWNGVVLFPDDVVANVGEIADTVYDVLDGGDYEEDPHYWERASTEAVDVSNFSGEPSFVAAHDADGDLRLVAIGVEGLAAAEAELRARLAEVEEEPS